MSTVTGVAIGILAVVVAFGFIIFIHEMGHFLTARAVDIRCPQFAIGFGPKLFGFRWRGTQFAVRLFPLGGYVLMNGEEPGSRDEDPWAATVAAAFQDEPFPATPERLRQRLLATPESERGEAWQEVYDQVTFARCREFPDLRSVEGNFHDRSIPARILVISGGVLMNFLATILILWCLAPVVGVGAFFRDWAPAISQVSPGMPAAEAGVESGDWIVSVGDRSTATFAEAFEAIGGLACQPTEMVFRKRDGREVSTLITPLLALGNERFARDAQGRLVVSHSEQHPEAVGRVVLKPEWETLVAEARQPGPRELRLTLEGSPEPVRWRLGETFRGGRGQIGILFGVSDIRFEKEWTTVVAEVAPGSAAAQGGLKAGDQIAFVGDFPLLANSGLGFGSLLDPALEAQARLARPLPLEVFVVREGQGEALTLSPSEPAQSMEDLGIRLVPLTASDKVGAPFVLIGQLLRSPYDILSMWWNRQATGQEIVENMQGPVGIMTLIYQLRDNGLYQFLFFIALLNAAIGAFNLLPFPALDGARLVFLFLAALRGGRQVDPDKEAKVHLLGLMLLLCFVVVVTFGDIKRLIASHVFVM